MSKYVLLPRANLVAAIRAIERAGLRDVTQLLIKDTVPHCVSVSPSFDDVQQQIYFECFTDSFGRGLAASICHVIADVYAMPAHAAIKINGVQKPVAHVQEIYMQLDNEHVSHVVDNFGHAGEVKNKTAYLQTSLYNAVVESGAHMMNAARGAYRAH